MPFLKSASPSFWGKRVLKRARYFVLIPYLLEGSGEIAAVQDVSITSDGKIFASDEVIAFTATLQVPAEKKIISVSVDFTKE